jgi:hypothetical protein
MQRDSGSAIYCLMEKLLDIAFLATHQVSHVEQKLACEYMRSSMYSSGYRWRC